MTAKRLGRLILTASFLLTSAASSNAATVTSIRVKGDTATAIFDGIDPTDPGQCLENFVSVTASDLIEKDKPNGKVLTFNIALVVSQFDRCTDTLVFNGDGFSSSQTFQVAADLSSATATAEVSVFDPISGHSYPVSVELSWKATSATTSMRSRETFKDTELGIKIKSVFRSTLVDAVATGMVLGLGTNLAAGPSESATIQKQNDGGQIITRTP